MYKYHNMTLTIHLPGAIADRFVPVLAVLQYPVSRALFGPLILSKP